MSIEQNLLEFELRRNRARTTIHPTKQIRYQNKTDKSPVGPAKTETEKTEREKKRMEISWTKN